MATLTRKMMNQILVPVRVDPDHDMDPSSIDLHIPITLQPHYTNPELTWLEDLGRLLSSKISSSQGQSMSRVLLSRDGKPLCSME